MKKLKAIFLLLTVLLISISLFSCGNSDEDLKEDIIGSWELTEDSKYSFSDDYPDNEITFESNGRFWLGYYDHLGHYYIEEGTIVMSCSNWSSDYQYKISMEKGLLKLQYKGYSPVYYQRVN